MHEKNPERPLKPICGDCAYWKRNEEGVREGECRRGNIAVKQVPIYHWCGRHDLFDSYIRLLSKYQNYIIEKSKKGVE